MLFQIFAILLGIAKTTLSFEILEENSINTLRNIKERQIGE